MYLRNLRGHKVVCWSPSLHQNKFVQEERSEMVASGRSFDFHGFLHQLARFEMF